MIARKGREVSRRMHSARVVLMAITRTFLSFVDAAGLYATGITYRAGREKNFVRSAEVFRSKCAVLGLVARICHDKYSQAGNDVSRLRLPAR